jgi:hypothetical protein
LGDCYDAPIAEKISMATCSTCVSVLLKALGMRSYQQALRRAGNMLFIEESPGDDVTPTLAGLREIKTYLTEKTFPNRRDVLSVYQRVLMRKAA